MNLGKACVVWRTFERGADRRLEEKNPQLAQDIRAIVEPHTQADPELKSARRYCNRSASDVLEALQKKGYAQEICPANGRCVTFSKRMNYRLKRIRKGKPLKKTPECNAIFANVKAVKAEVKARTLGNIRRYESEGERRRLRSWGEKPGPARTARWRRDGIMIRRRLDNGRRWAF